MFPGRFVVRLWGCLFFGSVYCWMLSGCAGLPAADSSPAPPAKSLTARQADVSVAGKNAPQRRSARFRPGKPLTWFESANFVGSGRCSVCHTLLQDSAGNDTSISNHWRSTMMANAAKDPLWLAKVSSEVARHPELKQVIESKCATCHMPMAWTQAGTEYGGPLILGDGFLSPRAALHKAAMDGVSCSLCHQIKDVKLGTKASFSGQYSIDTDQSAPERKIYGPYHDAVERPMRTSVGFTPVYGPQVNDAALCGTCHTLFIPYVDSTGKVAGEFPEQMVYPEWKHSEFGVSADRRYDIGENRGGTSRICQECHMPHSVAGGVRIAKWAPPEVKERDHFSQHHFVGGNVFMLNILQDNIDDLGLTTPTDKLEDTKTRTLNQLQGESARLSLVKAGSGDQTLTVVLQVGNMAGHKFPTGFPSRNLWLHFMAVDRQGQVVFESGKPLPGGRIAGNNAEENPSGFEPHYDVITSAGQVQIYEAVMEDTDGAVTYTLLRGARYRKDNRLLPRGFDKSTAPPEIAVHGAAAEDVDFSDGRDQITYEVTTSGYAGPFTIVAELLYQTVSHGFMQDLRQDAELPLVARFNDYYGKADKTPVTVAALQVEVP